MINDDFLGSLSAITGLDNLIIEPTLKQAYEIDWRSRFSGKSIAVVKPCTVFQIQQIVKLCKEYQIAIIPQGGNTSLCGGSIPLTEYNRPQLILNLSNLNQILDINTQNNSITVEAGCTLAKIIETANQYDRYFPLSISSEGSCQIGGNIATNAGGIHVVKYGMMRNLVLGLESIMPNGDILNQLTTLRKNNLNFDLKQLLIGSEGTLGIITKATLKLFAKPDQYVTVLFGMSNLNQAINILNNLQVKFNVCAFEVIHNLVQELYDKHFPDSPIPFQDEWLILFEIEAPLEFDIEILANNLINLNIDLDRLVIAESLAKRDLLWKIRERIPLAEKMNGIAIKHDISLPISHIQDFVNINRSNILKIYPDAQILCFGHLGDGNLHYNIQLSDLSKTKLNEAEVNKIVYNDVLKFGGSISAEHGIGQLKTSWYQRLADPTSYNLAKQIKDLIDPENIFNPGKIFK